MKRKTKEENLPPGITIDENRFMNAFAHLLLAMGFWDYYHCYLCQSEYCYSQLCGILVYGSLAAQRY